MGYMIQNSNYFRQHPFNLNGVQFDYVSVILGYGWSIQIPYFNTLGPGGQGTITKDCFGRWYLSVGETGGMSLMPLTMCIVGGRITNGDREHLDDTLANFIPGKSCNITIGAGGCIGESQCGNIQAFEIGFSTPQISISTNWADDIDSLIKKFFN